MNYKPRGGSQMFKMSPRTCFIGLVIIVGLMLFARFVSMTTSTHTERPISTLLRLEEDVVVEATPPPSTWRASPVGEEEALAALRRHSHLLKNLSAPPCDVKFFGDGWGKHSLCQEQLTTSCYGITYGISGDYSFERELVTTRGCKVLGLDPTVNYNAELLPNFYFLKFGAPGGPSLPANWVIGSPVAMYDILVPTGRRLSLLKMDCEGCEYYLYDSVMDGPKPDFFSKVDQFALEIHISKMKGWMETRREMLNFGRLLGLLNRAGLHLVHIDITSCSPVDEKHGCIPELASVGIECTPGTHCHNYLFARI